MRKLAMRIGIFDSGLGGRSVAQAVRDAFPEAVVVFKDDHANLPYGSKSPDEMLRHSLAILLPMAQDCNVIVIACNTLTTNVIQQLRRHLPIPLVGLEPMVKPAAHLTQTGIIAVCATPATLSSARYAWLKAQYAQGITVLEPDCSQWATMIEGNRVNELAIDTQVEKLCTQKADVIVLGCTHYHWLEKEVQQLAAGRATVLQPEQAVIMQLQRVLTRNHPQ